jgi:hypothetical protein
MHLARKAIGARVVGIDGDIGTAIDFYFEHDPLAVRHLLVRTGGRRSGKRLLIPTTAVHGNWDVTGVHVSLTKANTWDSPRFWADAPVSRESDATMLEPPPFPAATPQPGSGKGAPHDALKNLWSVAQSTGCHVRATNGDIGHVADFLIRQDFRVPFLIVNTSNRFGGRSVVVSSDALERVDGDRLIYVKRARDTLVHASAV